MIALCDELPKKTVREPHRLGFHGPYAKPIPRPRAGFNDGHNRCYDRIAQLSMEAIAELVKYADHRLAVAGSSSVTGGDIVQDAIQAILVGTNSIRKGRHPRDEATASRTAFLRYLRGVIRSLVDAVSRSERINPLLNIEDEWSGAALNPSRTVELCCPSEIAGMFLFGREFFARLRSITPRSLLPILDAWEAEYPWLTQIPLAGKRRKHRQQIRALALRVHANMGPTSKPKMRTMPARAGSTRKL